MRICRLSLAFTGKAGLFCRKSAGGCPGSAGGGVRLARGVGTRPGALGPSVRRYVSSTRMRTMINRKHLLAALAFGLLPMGHARAINIVVDYTYDTNNFFNTFGKRSSSSINRASPLFFARKVRREASMRGLSKVSVGDAGRRRSLQRGHHIRSLGGGSRRDRDGHVGWMACRVYPSRDRRILAGQHRSQRRQRCPGRCRGGHGEYLRLRRAQCQRVDSLRRRAEYRVRRSGRDWHGDQFFNDLHRRQWPDASWADF